MTVRWVEAAAGAACGPVCRDAERGVSRWQPLLSQCGHKTSIQKVSNRRYLPAGAAARGDVGRLPVNGPARRALPPPAVNTRGRDRQMYDRFAYETQHLRVSYWQPHTCLLPPSRADMVLEVHLLNDAAWLPKALQ